MNRTPNAEMFFE